MIELIVLSLLLFILVIVVIAGFYNLVAVFLAAPFVPTSKKDIDEILRKANLKKGQHFFELGGGDGRVVRKAVKDYQVKGIMVELNPIFITWSRFLCLIDKIKMAHKRGNFFNTSLKEADVIYLFLMPKAVNKLADKILAECKTGTLVISRGFKIKNFEKDLVLTVPKPHFSAYYYLLK